MEPIPATVRAVEELGPFARGGNLLEELSDMGRRVERLVPDCVGLSLVSEEFGATFTLLASHGQLTLLDALQREGGTGRETGSSPADDGQDRPPTAATDLLDEEVWRLLALDGAARCVLSTLTLPLRAESGTAGAVNLYGASRQAFTGHHEELAGILGAWAPGAVTNADLSFSTLRDAEEAPRRLRRACTIDEASALVADVQHVAVETARERLHEAAERAGISEEQLAEAVLRLRGP
jgi:hypothetical protein